MRISRRGFLLAGSVLGSGLGVGAYAFGVEPRWPELTHTTIGSRWLTPGSRLRVLHLSDLHASPEVPFDWIEAAFQMGLAEKPDVICLSGDYVTDGREVDSSRYRKLLETLPMAAPTFASLGNHDGGTRGGGHRGFRTSEPMRRLLAAAGLEVMHNRSVECRIAGQRLQIIGLGDLWAREFDFQSGFQGLARNADCLRLVLSHNPDTKGILQYGSWELMLAGHTHGGQVIFPVIGPPILPVQDTAYYRGLYTWQGRRLYITRGVGGVYGAVRFNCRPEVTILDLVPGESPVELTESRPTPVRAGSH